MIIFSPEWSPQWILVFWAIPLPEFLIEKKHETSPNEFWNAFCADFRWFPRKLLCDVSCEFWISPPESKKSSQKLPEAPRSFKKLQNQIRIRLIISSLVSPAIPIGSTARWSTSPLDFFDPKRQNGMKIRQRPAETLPHPMWLLLFG